VFDAGSVHTPFPRLAPAVLLLLTGLSAVGATAPQPGRAEVPAGVTQATQLQDAFADVAGRVFPCVVLVTSYERTPPNAPPTTPNEPPGGAWQESHSNGYPGFTKLASGSGFFIDAAAHVLTLRQLVTRSDGSFADLVDIETSDGMRALAQIVGVEPTLDLAVLEFAITPTNGPRKLPAATIGDSDSVLTGHWAIALGEIEGPGRVFVPGSVSSTPERQCYQDEMSATFMLISSPGLHPEAYGGPVVNIRGQVIGVSMPTGSIGVMGNGLARAMPIDIVLPVYKGIIQNQSARSPWLGVSVLEMSAWRNQFTDPAVLEAQPRPRIGIYIDNVFDPSPAARAGIQVGDFLVRLNGTLLTSAYRFQEQLYLAGVGHAADVEVFRGGQTLRMHLTVEERPAAAVPR